MPRVPKVVVSNRQRAVVIDLRSLQDFAERALERCLRCPTRRAKNLTRQRAIHVVLISDRRMSQIHRRFLGIGGPTDVITFQHGEIFISVQTAQRQAREFNSSLKREIQLYLVHGLLHLHGYDDQTPASKRLIAATQKRVLREALRE
jgi:probable rRNA maturation factor